MASVNIFRLGLLRLRNVNVIGKRNSHSAMHGKDMWYGAYRGDIPPRTYGPVIYTVRILQTIVWFYIFYNFWYDPGTLLGHPAFSVPNPKLWTDEELGIPPDDYDEVV